MVYKARQVSLNCVVTLKMILAGQLAGEEDVRRFYTEAARSAQLAAKRKFSDAAAKRAEVGRL